LAAMMPAMRETERTSPFFSAAVLMRRKVSGDEKRARPTAMARRVVCAFGETLTMCAVPVGVRCGSLESVDRWVEVENGAVRWWVRGGAWKIEWR